MAEFKETAEKIEETQHPPGSKRARLLSLFVAIVAVLAALSNLASTHRSLQAILAKNEAIVSFARASDTYNYYEAKAIREEVYRAAILTSGHPHPDLQKLVEHEHTTKKSVLAKAREYEKDADSDNSRSEHFQHSHEILEIGVMFFQISIVVFSISSITGAVLLPGLAALAALAGVVASVIGYFS